MSSFQFQVPADGDQQTVSSASLPSARDRFSTLLHGLMQQGVATARALTQPAFAAGGVGATSTVGGGGGASGGVSPPMGAVGSVGERASAFASAAMAEGVPGGGLAFTPPPPHEAANRELEYVTSREHHSLRSPLLLLIAWSVREENKQRYMLLERILLRKLRDSHDGLRYQNQELHT